MNRPLLQIVLVGAVKIPWVTLGLSVAGAQSDFRDLNPGTMGPFAVPTLPNDDPEVAEQVILDLQTVVAWGPTRLGDASFAPYFKLTVPFAGRAAMETWGTPFEVWRVTSQTQTEWQTPDQRGVSRGDLWVGARFLLLPEGTWWEHLPALAARFALKSTTGKDLENRRFLDAPLYVFDALIAKDVFRGRADARLERLRVRAKVGFGAWQQVEATQNDILDYGATLVARFRSVRTELEFRGAYGGQSDAQDKPNLVGLTLQTLGEHVDGVITVNAGLQDAPILELRAGIALHFDAHVLP